VSDATINFTPAISRYTAIKSKKGRKNEERKEERKKFQVPLLEDLTVFNRRRICSIQLM
jgi:hypothetical protein